MAEVFKKRIGIIRGGQGANYHRSLKKGGEIITHFLEHLSDKWKPVDILVDKEGVWHLGGIPIRPADLMHKVDIVWNTTQPKISQILRTLSVPFVGPESLHGVYEESREMLREHIRQVGIEIPRRLVIPAYQESMDGPVETFAIRKAKEVHAKFGAPWIIKSFTEEKSMGIHLAQTFGELVDAIEDGRKHNKSIEVEEFFSGKIASVHSLSGYRGEEVYTFPVSQSFGMFSREEKEKLENTARELSKLFRGSIYLRSDFVLTPRNKIYLLEMDWTPDLKPGSHFREACEAVGAKMHHVVEHILGVAASKR